MFDDIKAVLSADNRYMKFSISLYHDINIIYGCSGSGKSAFVADLLESFNAGLKVDSEDRILHLADVALTLVDGGKVTSLLPPENGSEYIVIFDDNKSIFYDIKVIDEVKRRKDCVFLIISRDPFGSNFSTSCFSEAVYSIDMCGEGTRRVYKFSTLCGENK